MRAETRMFEEGSVKHLLIISDDEEDSKLIDEIFGNKNLPIQISGEICLSDGYGKHYIRLSSNKSLRLLAETCFEQAVQLGWNEKEIPIPEMVALIHSEASEALESYRKGEPLSWTNQESNPPNKPEGIGSEFADILIRIGHYAKRLDIDLDYEVKRKLEYNMSRGYRHGGLKV